MTNTIQGKYTLIIIVVVTVFLAGLLGINYTLLKAHSLSTAKETSHLLLGNVDNQVNLALKDIEAIVSTLVESESVQQVDTLRMKDIFLANVNARSSYIRAIYLGTEEGKMYEWGQGPGFVENTPTFPEGYDPRIRPWYRTAVEQGGYAVTDPYIYASIKAMGVTAVKPVYADGKFVGVLGLDLIFDGLQNMVDSLNVEKGGRIVLLSRNHEILVDQFQPTEELITELEPFEYPEILASVQPYEIVTVGGIRYMVEEAVNLDTGWTILIFIPYDAIISFSQETVKIIIFYDLLIMMLLGVVVTFVSRRILTNPLESIIGVMREREQGDQQVRIPDQRVYEFKLIARLFNRLTDISDEIAQQQEERVRKRTEEVLSLQKENTRLRIVKEKEQLYSNLHDSLGARLTGIHISNTVARSALARGEYTLLEAMHNRIDQNAEQGIHDLRELLITNEAVPFTSDDLVRYIKKRMRERLALQNITFTYQLPVSRELETLEADLLSGLMRVFQEMVTNTLKYAEALHVELSMSFHGNRFNVSYHDDGLGFESKTVQQESFGIKGIIRRVKDLGGTVKLTTRPGRGVKYEISFPAGGEA